MTVELNPGMMLTRTGWQATEKKLKEADVQTVCADVKTAPKQELHQNSPVTVSGFTSSVSPELFSADMPKASADGSYMVGGVQFSQEEFIQSRSVIQSAISGLSVGTLDYKDYAKMGIAVSSVANYADSSLNAEQGDLLKSAIQEYTDHLVTSQQKILSGDDFVSGNRGDLSEYYGKEQLVDETRLKAINACIDEMNRVSGGNKAHISAGYTTATQNATNQSLISQITDLFSNLNLKSSSSVSEAMQQYKAMMTPALIASGTRADTADRVLDKQISEFMEQISGVFRQYNNVDAKI